MYYAYAKLASIETGFFGLFGTGLGGMLYAWARSLVAAKRHGLKVVFPTFPQVHSGPVLRNEPDWRSYWNLFRPPRGQVSGFRKLYLLATARRVPEKEFLAHPAQDSRETIVVFEGIQDYFASVMQEHTFVFDQLRKMTTGSQTVGLAHDFSGTISVHVRRGDFTKCPDPRVILSGTANYRIPIDWYCRLIREMRKALGKNIPINLFSDGTRRELAALLALGRVSRMGFGSSVADMLALSNSRVLVASGSQFSMWASYLGRMPVVWHKGQLRQRLYYDHPGDEVEWLDGGLPDGFVASMEAKLRSHV